MHRRTFYLALAIGCALAGAAAVAQDEVIPPTTVAIPDAPGKMVFVEITLVKLDPGALSEGGVAQEVDLPAAMKKWEENSQLRGLDQIQFTSLEHQSNRVQYGARVPIVTSTTYTGRTNELVHGIAIEDTGFMVVAEASVETDGTILLGLDVQKSGYEPTRPFKVTPLDPANPPKVTNEPHPTQKSTQINTAVRLRDKAVVIGRRVEFDGETKSEYVALAAARVAE